MPAHGRERSESNLQVIEQLAAELVHTALKDLHNTDSTALILSSPALAKDGSWLIEKQVMLWARDNGFAKIFQADSVANPRVQGLKIEYLPIESKVRYRAGDSLSADTITRSATVKFYMKAMTPDHRIVFAEEFSKNKIDTIRTSEVEQVENALFPFACTDKKKRGFFSAIVEPLIITIASGGVIYVFYSFRSK